MLSVCPRCRRRYLPSVRVCPVDGATLLAEAPPAFDEERTSPTGLWGTAEADSDDEPTHERVADDDTDPRDGAILGASIVAGPDGWELKTPSVVITLEAPPESAGVGATQTPSVVISLVAPPEDEGFADPESEVETADLPGPGRQERADRARRIEAEDDGGFDEGDAGAEGADAAEDGYDTDVEPTLPGGPPTSRVRGGLEIVEHHDDEVDELLGQYRLLRVLGEGGMALVYLAEHRALGRRFAIKRLRRDHFGDQITVGRFLAEARAVADVRHPNLCAIHDVVEEPDEIYLVMEYLVGRDLGQILREKGPLYPERAAMLCAQACDGLEAVHARGIIHRDLKPDNLFLAREPDGKERIKLLDFGVARLAEERPKALRTRTGQTVGTPQYMSPEQATASPIDARSDVYMMGVVLFELVTGRPPFVGEGYGEVMLMHVNDEPPRPSSLRAGLPLWLDEVILRCLAKEPDDRWASAKELAQALRRDVTTEITLPTRKAKVNRGMSSRAWLWVMGATLAAATAGAVAIGLAVTGREAPGTEVAVGEPLDDGGTGIVPGGGVDGGGAGGDGPVAPATGIATTGDADAGGVAESADEDTDGAVVVSRVHVVVEPVGATVRLGGETRCNAPCDVDLPRANAGVIELEASAPGFVDEKKLLDLGSPAAKVRFVLRRRPGR